MKKISIIVAVAEGNAIGKNNNLLCYISEDLKRFKRLTTGHNIIMGKKTFESLPKGPLPNRTNIVISDNPDDNFEGCKSVYSIDEALGQCSDEKESFIIGGGSIYRQFMPLANKLYITHIHKHFEADTFFPEIKNEEWQEISRENFPPDEVNDFSYSYVTYIRKSLV
ncbi:MAG: dihydrofolate reductase [Bacteroidales bacterium]|nr:dihydrofolate reductase [Bacteroidales bacterium]